MIAVHKAPSLEEKIELLGQAARYDLCGEACGTEAHRIRGDMDRWIYPAVLPDGQRVALLKILLTNVCTRDCAYCANRAGRDCPRTGFTPEELARTFVAMWQKGLVKGLFLSSGVGFNPQRTMDRILATAEIIRKRYRFPGYIHLKILPGADPAQVEYAGRLAQRVSINLEVPSAVYLSRLAPHKDPDELLAPLRLIAKLRKRDPTWAPAGATTQFVVGAAEESDRDLLTTVASLYERVGLRRAYFSAFQPVPDTPLESHPPTPLWREHRLYQSDFLMRQYGFTLEELPFDERGFLPREADPKYAWAQCHPELFPVEINTADRELLLRVPGIGPRSADRIIRWRRQAKLRSLADLRRTGAVVQRAAPFILLDGQRPFHQLPLL